MTAERRKVALVTGGAAGIGRACVEGLLDTGWRVLAVDIHDERLAALQDLYPVETLATARADVTRTSDCDRAMQAALEKFGRLDGLVANAGLQEGGDFLSTDEAHWRRLHDVNLLGVRNTCRAAMPALQGARRAAVVLIASVNAIRGSVGMIAYDAAKAGVVAMARGLACEFGAQGIRVNAVSPGATLTDFHLDRVAADGKTLEDLRAMTADYGLLRRAAEPLEIANAVVFLLSEQASFITGHNLVVDGGYSVTGPA